MGSKYAIASAAPLRGKKGTHYEGGLRVPFIAAWARRNDDNELQKSMPIPGGVLTDQVGTIYDLFPTILEVAGIRGEFGTLDGEDLSPLLRGEKSSRKPVFLMHFPHYLNSSYFTVYREGDWKLIYHYHRPQAERSELFNLREDRGESENLAAGRPDVRRHMIEAMAAALQDAGAQYPVSKTDRPVKLKPKVY